MRINLLVFLQPEGHLQEVVLEKHLDLVVLVHVSGGGLALVVGQVHESHVLVAHQHLVHALAHLSFRGVAHQCLCESGGRPCHALFRDTTTERAVCLSRNQDFHNGAV